MKLDVYKTNEHNTSDTFERFVIVFDQLAFANNHRVDVSRQYSILLYDYLTSGMKTNEEIMLFVNPRICLPKQIKLSKD